MKTIWKLMAAALVTTVSLAYGCEPFVNAPIIRGGIMIDQLPSCIMLTLDDNGSPQHIYLTTDEAQEVNIAVGDEIKTNEGKVYRVKQITLLNEKHLVMISLKPGKCLERDLYIHRKDGTVRRYTKN